MPFSTDPGPETATETTGRDLPRPRRRPVTDIALIAVFAALIAACSLIAIPIGVVPVPITLQTFAVLLAGAVLGATRGFLAVLLYLAIGAIGLPVFAGGAAGLAPFAGPTVGFLVSFPFAAWLAGLLVSRLRTRSVGGRALLVFLVLLPSTALIYALGIPGMTWLTSLTLGQAFVFNLAFIPFDLVKAALAAVVATAVHRAFPDLMPRRRVPPRR